MRRDLEVRFEVVFGKVMGAHRKLARDFFQALQNNGLLGRF